LVTAVVALAAIACAANSTEEPPTTTDPLPKGNPTSCFGHCGDGPSEGDCYCDDQCSFNGDCCSDFEDACGKSGSGGEGGGSSGGGGKPSSGGSGGTSGGGGTPAVGGGGGSGGGCSASLCNSEIPAYEGGKVCFCDKYCGGDSADCCSNKTAVCG
jgi:hypothetical protein